MLQTPVHGLYVCVLSVYQNLWASLSEWPGSGLLFFRTQDCVHIHGVLYFWVNQVAISALRKFSENKKPHILEGSISIYVTVWKSCVVQLYNLSYRALYRSGVFVCLSACGAIFVRLARQCCCSTVCIYLDIFTSHASSKTIVIDLGKRAWKPAYFESSLFIIHEC